MVHLQVNEAALLKYLTIGKEWGEKKKGLLFVLFFSSSSFVFGGGCDFLVCLSPVSLRLYLPLFLPELSLCS